MLYKNTEQINTQGFYKKASYFLTNNMIQFSLKSNHV